MSDNQGNGGDKLIYFLIGAGIGAVTAMLFAPKAGSELRSEIAGATKRGLDYARDTGREFGERATEYYQTGIDRASEYTERSKEVVADISDKAQDIVNRQKSQLTAAIEAGKQGYREAKQADKKMSAALDDK